jgi:hypothetical protein
MQVSSILQTFQRRDDPTHAAAAAADGTVLKTAFVLPKIRRPPPKRLEQFHLLSSHDHQPDSLYYADCSNQKGHKQFSLCNNYSRLHFCSPDNYLSTPQSKKLILLDTALDSSTPLSWLIDGR